MEVVKFANAPLYYPPNHDGVTGRRLQGDAASSADIAWVGYSDFPPGVVVPMEAGPFGKIYVVTQGALTGLLQIKYHHINLCTEDVQRLSAFYRSVFDLDPISDYQRVNTDDTAGYAGNVDFLTDGEVEFHLARKDVDLGFHMQQVINPLERGHFCFRTDNIEEFKRRLDLMTKL